jgi:tRNA1(Val) A37 N6-methylase TrmN6
MFGVSDGFDVVIANPPYGVSIRGDLRIDTENSLGKVPDYEIYYYFIEVAKALLVSNGIMIYIIPNTILSMPKNTDSACWKNG